MSKRSIYPKELTGLRFGKLVVIGPAERASDETRPILWDCQCDCGNTISAKRTALVSGRKQSCGCLAHAQKHSLNLVGHTFGRLTSVRPTTQRAKRSKCVIWECHCSCGNTTYVSSKSLMEGKVKSCGCLKEEYNGQRGNTAKYQERHKDYTGRRFGMLIAIRPLHTEKGKCSRWECLCDCGVYKTAHTSNLLGGRTLSCGCLKNTGYNTHVYKSPDDRFVSLFTAASNYTMLKISGDSFLVPSHVNSSKDIFALTPSSEMLYRMLEEGCYRDEMLRGMTARFDVSLEEASEDLDRFIASLVNHNLVQVSPCVG